VSTFKAFLLIILLKSAKSLVTYGFVYGISVLSPQMEIIASNMEFCIVTYTPCARQ
jgi:hypothetical protein